MRRTICTAALLAASLAPAAFAQETKKKTTDGKPEVTAARQAGGAQRQERNGTDCSRPGGKCNKRQPRKPWFFGK
jgi:hypothetical protein